MNFFGTTNSPNTKKPTAKGNLAAQKKWHSTNNLLEDAVKPVKFQSTTRRNNRKNNLDTRSLWYDYSEEEDAPEFRHQLRKCASSGNLLNSDGRNVKPLTKDMISLPRSPRKIIGEWASRTNSRMFEESFGITEIVEEAATDDLDGHEEVNTDAGEEEHVEVGEDVADPQPRHSSSSSASEDIEEDVKDDVDETEDDVEDACKFVDGGETSGDNEVLVELLDVVIDSPSFGASAAVAVAGSSVHIGRFERPDKGVGRWKMSGSKSEKSSQRKVRTKADISGPSDLRQIEEGETSNLMGMKFLSKSTDVHLLSHDVPHFDDDEVLRNLQSNRDDPVSRGIGPFPKHDDFKCPEDEIQIRHHSNSTKSRQSKTVDYDFRRKSPPKTPDFQVIGCTKIHLPNEQSMMKLKKNEEYILYQNNVIYKVDSSKSQLPLKFGVIFKSARSLNKKEVELRDSNSQVYLFIFDSSKDAKNFTENDNLACLFDSEKSTITKTLLRLLGKRSSREVLEKKGIYQNETVFGNTLAHIYKLEKGVPSFILKVIELIERPDNITSVGLYRTSGNLATIQKIRLEVDKGNPGVLDNYAKDPDVLTGSLKLFFRELKEPLVSCQTCDNLSSLARSDKTYCKKDKDKVRTILKHLPEANSSTLLVLIRHLIEVVKYKDHNKMDTYNLAVCWGPTLIFATGASGSSKDPVTQSAEATRLFDALLSFYIDHPEEMELRTGGGRGWLDANMNAIQRGDSRESVVSGGEGGGGSKLQKKSSSNLSIEMIDEGLRKAVELIENVIKTNGLYKKSGSLERTNKIVKKMTKKKIAEMEKYKNDVHELTDSLKKYMREVHEPLVTKEVVDHINKICDNGRCPDDPAARRLISTIISDLPQRHSLLFLVRHLAKVIDHEPAHHVPKSDILAVWASVLSDRMVVDSEERYAAFLAAMVDVFGGEEVRGEVRGMPDGLLDDLRSAQREKDRVSRYDNVPDVEGKTDEHTKL